MNVICELVMVTYDIGPSLSPFVARVVKIIRNNPTVTHLLTPMGSILEGEWQDINNLINQIFLELSPDYERIGITVKYDYRRNKTNRMTEKVISVEEKI